MELTEEYLYCYSKLSDPSQSKKVNRRLLQIQQSQDGWALAQNLINHSQPGHHIHGYQLLSKKLNKPPPKEISIQGIISFIYSKINKTSIHWICIAKAVLHLNPKQALNQTQLSKSQMIKLVKQMPSAISQIRTNPPLDGMQLKQKYLSTIMPILIDSFDNNPSQVLQCISMFLQQGIKLNSNQMMLKLLSQKIQIIGSILHDILQKEIYNNLQGQIVQFFDKNRTSKMLPSIVMSFYKNININNINTERLTYQIQYILACLLSQQQQKQTYLLCNSYQFWQQLFNNLENKHLQSATNNIILSAICSLWNIICSSSKFIQLPSCVNSLKSNDSLSLDVDQLQYQNQEIINQTVLQVNNKANKFRDYGQDFITMCLKYIKNQPSILQIIFNYIQQLTKATLIQIQLSIYIIINILQTQQSLLNYLKPSIHIIFKRKQQYTQYLCSRIITLIGKLQNFITLDETILPQSLSFLLICIHYQKLSNIASQNCCQLLQQLKINNNNMYEQLQLFINQLYNILFKIQGQGQIKQKVIQNLTKTITIYLYKFNKGNTTTSSSYQKYLQFYSNQISSFNKIKKKKYLEAIILAQYWLNIKDQQTYLICFSKFLDKQIQFFMVLVCQSQNKQELSQAIYMINIAIKTNAILIIDKWLQIIQKIFIQYLTQQQNKMYIIFTPFKNIINSAVHLQHLEVIQKLFIFIYKWIEPITLILLNQQKHQFTLTSIIIEIHLIIIKTYKIYQNIPSVQQTAFFSVKNMINYLINYIHSTQLYQFQVFKFSLQYYTIALELGIDPQPIVSNILCNYNKLADTLWKYIQTILYYIYKKYGPSPILSGLKDAKSSLNEENPLTAVLMESLQKNQGKNVKNILLSLC